MLFVSLVLVLLLLLLLMLLFTPCGLLLFPALRLLLRVAFLLLFDPGKAMLSSRSSSEVTVLVKVRIMFTRSLVEGGEELKLCKLFIW